MRRTLRTNLACLLVTLALSTPLYAQHTDFFPRPFPMGVSISATPTSPFITAGTAGMRVRPLWNANLVFILTNAHVIDAVSPELCTNSASPLSTWVLQPGTLDIGNDPGNDSGFFGGVFAISRQIDFSGGDNVIDAALAYTLESIASREILGIGVPTVAFVEATPGLAVMKSGRTTGVTTGTVNAVNTTATITYPCGQTARFVRQITMGGGIGSSGDSGSVILASGSLTPVALFFAGSAFSGIANPIIDVYRAFGAIVDGSGSRVSDEAAFERALDEMPAHPELRRLEGIQARHEDQILATRGVTGIGIGRSADNKGLAFVVFTRDNPARVPVAVPTAIEGVPVRLSQSGELRAL